MYEYYVGLLRTGTHIPIRIRFGIYFATLTFFNNTGKTYVLITNKCTSLLHIYNVKIYS